MEKEPIDVNESVAIIRERDWDEADKQIDERLAAGEDLALLYACYHNEMEYWATQNPKPAWMGKLRAMKFYLEWRIAGEFMEKKGWIQNDEGRYVRIESINNAGE